MRDSPTSRRDFARTVALAAFSASCAPVRPPRHPAAPAAAPVTAPPEPPSEIDRIVADLRGRYGRDWSEEQVDSVRAIVRDHLEAAEVLRRHPMTNADAPLSGVWVPPSRP